MKKNGNRNMNIFEIETTKLSNYIKAVTKLYGGFARIKINQDGWETIMLEPSGVAMVDVKLFKNDFFVYPEDIKKDIEFVIDFDKFMMFIRKVEKGGNIAKIIIDDEMKITVDGITRTFMFLDKEKIEYFKIPSLTFDVICYAPSDIVMNALHVADTLSEYVTMIAEKDKWVIKAENGNEKMIAIFEDNVNFNNKEISRVIATYPLDFLIDIIDVVKDWTALNVCFEYSKDNPLKISAGENIFFLIAPRVEE